MRDYNPDSDRFVEASYRGYVVRCIAHFRQHASYIPTVEISVREAGMEAVICEYEFPYSFFDADEAVDRAVNIGRQAVDGLIKIYGREGIAIATETPPQWLH